ncbi:MAG TPA: glycosyltransferase [Thermoplasmata archaeon]|nr:glycosyltransferase [Thermoplasmata archaeon]
MAERAHPEDPGFSDGSPYRKHLLKRYAFANTYVKGKTVLDVPCGVGWGTSLLNAKSLIGIDISQEAIDYGKKHYPGIEFLTGDMANIPLSDKSIDVIVCLEGFEHVRKDVGLKFLKEAVRVLGNDGLLVMTCPVILPEGKHSGNPYHLHEPAIHDFERVLKNKFEVLKLEIVRAPDGHVAYFVGKKKQPMIRVEGITETKKHVLLTTSTAPSQSPFSTTEKRPPIGLGFLISVLRDAGHEVFFIDNYLQPSDFLETDYLQKNAIDFVGIYANTICYRDTLRMFYRLEWLRRTSKWKGKIIVGGPHTTVCLDTIPDFVDYVVQGEGEQAILDIVEGRATERVVKYPRIKNLDELPMPAWDYFVNLSYNWGGEWFPEEPVFTMNTSRGCPFRCAFCSVGSIWGKKYTYFSAERIISDIEHLIKHYGAKGIYFREDNFTLNKKRLTRFCNLLLEKGIKISWACETRVNTLDREVVELMARAGACGFYFGVESGSQRVLDFLKKDITIEQTRNAFKLCHEFGIKMAASVVVGVPTETETELNQTIALLKVIRPTVTWFNVFVGIPNSELYQYVINNKLYEFIDDRGLVYLKGHNERVRKFYGGGWDAEIPVSLCQNEPTNPKISVVMSVHNGEKYLKEAIESVLRQTYQDFEFIIVEDASNDKTDKILKSFDDPRIKIIRNQENLGLTKSLNKGIKAAKGKYIARMDADDISIPHRFEMQVEFLEKNTDYAVVGSSYYQVNENGKVISIVGVLTTDSDIRNGLKRQNWFGHGSVMMRKDAVLKVEGYDERFRYAQDYDLWLRIAENYKMANLEEPFYCWRSTQSSISKEKESEQRHYANLAISEAAKRQTVKTVEEKMGVSLTDPVVSVIVPTYNRPGMLTDVLKSIFNQTYQDFEIIVVNDAGAGVENVIESFNQNDNITYVKHSKNRGLAAARNTGIKIAKGKYIALLDDDDIFYPNHLETAIKYLNDKNPVIYTDAVRATFAKCGDAYKLTGESVPYSMDFDRNKLLIGNIAPVNCFVFDRDIAIKAGLFDETFSILEDWEFWLRLSALSPLKHIAEETVQVNWRTDGTTMTSSRGAEFKKNRERIYKKYQNEIKNIPNTNEILQEFNAIWTSDGKVPMSFTSIIILTHNQLEYTKKCIDSIFKYTKEPFELIVVDNGSTDGTVGYLKKVKSSKSKVKDSGYCKDIEIIENKENRGFAMGNNQGMAIAKGDYVLLLNNDIVVTQGWLEKMLAKFKEDKKIGIVGPRTNYVVGPQLVPKVTYSDNDMKEMQKFAEKWSCEHAGKSFEMNRVIGFCMLISRGVVEKIGGLDARFGSGNFEDDDFCLRARIAGYKIVVADDVFIHHFGSRTFIGAKIDYHCSMESNWVKFKNKWGISPDRDIKKGYVFQELLSQPFDFKKHYQPLKMGENFNPDAEPVSISDKRGFSFLAMLDWSDREDKWSKTLLEYIEAFNPKDDVSLILRVDPERGETAEVAQEKLLSLIRCAGYDSENIPDIVIVDQFLADNEKAGLYAAADVFIPAGESNEVQHVLEARVCGLEILEDVSAKGMRSAFKVKIAGKA